MGDENNGLALSPEQIHDFEKSLDLLRSEDGSGFIQDQDLRIPVKSLEDFNPLTDSDREIFYQGTWFYFQLVILRKIQYPLGNLFAVQKTIA